MDTQPIYPIWGRNWIYKCNSNWFHSTRGFDFHPIQK